MANIISKFDETLEIFTSLAVRFEIKPVCFLMINLPVTSDFVNVIFLFQALDLLSILESLFQVMILR